MEKFNSIYDTMRVDIDLEINNSSNLVENYKSTILKHIEQEGKAL